MSFGNAAAPLGCAPAVEAPAMSKLTAAAVMMVLSMAEPPFVFLTRAPVAPTGDIVLVTQPGR